MKIAQSTCVRCHGIFPRTEMSQINVTENAGTSLGLSRNLKGGSTSRGSFRVYRRNKKIWVCDDCISIEETEKDRERGIMVVVLLIAFAVGVIIAMLN